MRRLDRYVLAELIVPFLIGTLSVTMMFQANLLIALFKEFQLTNVPAAAVAQVILFKTPQFLSMTLPVGTTLAASLAIARLTRESELTAMRSCGISILRILTPILVFGALVAVGNFYLVERVMPRAEKQARKLMNEVGILGLAPDFKPNVQIQLKNYLATFGSVSRGRDREGSLNLTDVLLIERRGNGEKVIIDAPGGQYKGGVWTINKPILRILRGQDMISATTQKDMTINEKITLADLFLPPQQEEQSMEDLRTAIAQGKQLKRDTTGLEVAYHTRFSVPAACFIFALTGSVFAILFSRSGPFMGVLVSIALVIVYYNAYVISTAIIGRNQWLSPWLSAWLPDLVFLAVGLIYVRRSE